MKKSLHPATLLAINVLTLIKTSLLNAIAVGVKMLTLLALNKILAVLVGPSGYGIIGQLQNAITAITAIASAGVSTGVTKYTAEYNTEPEKQRHVWITATFLGLIFSLIAGVSIIAFRGQIALFVTKDVGYSYIFVYLAPILILFAANTFMLAVLNGLKEINLLICANILNSIIALAVISILAYIYGLDGALVGLIINQSIVCFATGMILIRKPWLKVKNFIGWPHHEMTIKLMHFAIMAFTTSVLGPLTQLVIRNIVINNAGINAGGHWEAMNRISSIILTIISTTLTIYLIPKLSELKLLEEHKSEIKNTLKILIPSIGTISLFTYVYRDDLIDMLFTKEFLGMKILFGWQLIGDVIRSISWVFSFYLLSQSETKKFILAETLTSIFYIGSAFLTIEIYGLLGTSMAYTLTNIFYLLLLAILAAPALRKQDVKD